MSARMFLLLSAVLAAVLTELAPAAETGAAEQRSDSIPVSSRPRTEGSTAPRALAFAALPNWTGLWETEAAVRLVATGKLEPPKLWGKPPYNAEWEKKSQGGRPSPGPAARPTDLPPAVKVCEPGGFP